MWPRGLFYSNTGGTFGVVSSGRWVGGGGPDRRACAVHLWAMKLVGNIFLLLAGDPLVLAGSEIFECDFLISIFFNDTGIPFQREKVIGGKRFSPARGPIGISGKSAVSSE